MAESVDPGVTSSAADPARTPFELEIGITPDDIDELGHVNNTVYLRWVQDAAVAHWTHVTTPDEQAQVFWVVARHEIDYKRPAFADDAIIARTWIGGTDRTRFYRHTDLLRVSDRKLLARVVTQYAAIDPQTMRPTNVSDELRARFSLQESGA